jgi:ABC-type transporter Mla MlaB component
MQIDHVYADKQLVIARAALPGLLSIMGAIDCFNADAVANALEEELRRIHEGIGGASSAIGPDTRPRVDVSRLEIVDTYGVEALIKVAKRADELGGVVINGLPPVIHRVIELLESVDLPGTVREAGHQPECTV